MKRRRILIGGRMGTGKSTVARMLGALGGYVISSDEIGHQVQEPGSEVADQIMKRWPDVTKDGRIDRHRLAAIVFSDRQQLRDLEDLTHAAIRSRIQDLVNQRDESFVVVEVPVLADLVQGTWVRVTVDAPDFVCRSRLRIRGMSDSEITDRWAMQPSRTAWLRNADFCLANKGDMAELEHSVRQLAYRLGLIDA